MTIRYQGPVPLGAHHTFENFSCSSREQTDWLRQHSRQSQANGSTKVFVVTAHSSEEVVAYYAWRMAEITIADSPQRLRKGTGKYPQPVALLARLGVDTEHEGNGIGAGMLSDVIRRILGINAEIGCRGLLIHSENDTARRFYMHLIPELMESPTDQMHLVLFMKDARHTLLGN